MTNQTESTKRPALPALSLDYAAGLLTNTLTGESASHISGVVLAWRSDRVLYPTISEQHKLPICVNGSTYGPCLCGFADWGKDGSPPDCAEELTLLLWQDDGAQVVTLTARRSQVRTISQYLDMKAVIDGVLHDQRVTVRMTPDNTVDGPAWYRLTLMPGEKLESQQTEQMAAVAGRVTATGAFGGLA